MKALPNNNKPATHFIEVWSDGVRTYTEPCNEIEILRECLSDTAFIKAQTIAIFKIRLK